MIHINRTTTNAAETSAVLLDLYNKIGDIYPTDLEGRYEINVEIKKV